MARYGTVTASVSVACVLAAQACSGDGTTPPAAGPGTGAGGSVTLADAGSPRATDFDPVESDFECITRGTRVRSFFVRNGLGQNYSSLR